MCGVCEKEATVFVFPKKDENRQAWFERVTNLSKAQFVMMKQSNENLKQILKSYKLQGFTFHHEPNLMTVLLIRDLIFMNYTQRFANEMGWK